MGRWRDGEMGRWRWGDEEMRVDSRYITRTKGRYLGVWTLECNFPEEGCHRCVSSPVSSSGRWADARPVRETSRLGESL